MGPSPIGPELPEQLRAVQEERDRLNTRCHELERMRELYQERRDQAIREQREAEEALRTVMDQTPLVRKVLDIQAAPGSVLAITVPDFENEQEKKSVQTAIAFIAKRHPEWTLMVTHPGKEIRFEVLPEAIMRAKGWIRAERVEPGPRVLEAALGAYRAALERALIVTGGDDSLGARRFRDKVRELIGQPLPSFSAEVKPSTGGAA